MGSFFCFHSHARRVTINKKIIKMNSRSFTSTFIDTSFKEDITDFSPIGQCDISKFVVYMKDMVPYLEYSGTGLYNTGILAHEMFVDEPQPANLSPRIILDPEPVMNPRPILNFLPWP